MKLKATRSGNISSNPYAANREATGRNAYDPNQSCENQTYNPETG